MCEHAYWDSEASVWRNAQGQEEHCQSCHDDQDYCDFPGDENWDYTNCSPAALDTSVPAWKREQPDAKHRCCCCDQRRLHDAAKEAGDLTIAKLGPTSDLGKPEYDHLFEKDTAKPQGQGDTA